MGHLRHKDKPQQHAAQAFVRVCCIRFNTDKHMHTIGEKAAIQMLCGLCNPDPESVTTFLAKPGNKSNNRLDSNDTMGGKRSSKH